jgi:hypothetical protein
MPYKFYHGPIDRISNGRTGSVWDVTKRVIDDCVGHVTKRAIDDCISRVWNVTKRAIKSK